ncbi:uncharacterized mitochondrial protein AtMg00860-like [Brassica napus]|uniref:uncharacterized mitochondrial protein AtMg00860-like n=1 Tax=Brassica napus TaxID=3708 RepID=UPI002078CE77|nr:uncharacterized mitochondrial protein AtMg00860-like [Brassica napus]
MTGLPAPKNVKDVQIFLGHAGFYRRFIQDFRKIARPLNNLLCKEVKFDFTPECMKAFDDLKKSLITAPNVQAPDWNLPFEIMFDASDFAIGAVLGKGKIKSCMPSTMPVVRLMKRNGIMQQQKKNYSP